MCKTIWEKLRKPAGLLVEIFGKLLAEFTGNVSTVNENSGEKTWLMEQYLCKCRCSAKHAYVSTRK